MNTPWLTGLIRDAAWPGLVVLVAHGLLGEVFGHEPYVDPAMHFLGGMAAAYFFMNVPRYLPSLFTANGPVAQRTLSFTATTTVAVLWEFAEFVGDALLGTRAHTSIASTLRDILNGMLGAALLLAWHHLVLKRRV